MNRPFSLRIVWLSLILASLSPFVLAGDSPSDKSDLPRLNSRAPEVTYKVEAGINGEVFPAFANYASLQNVGSRKWGTVGVTVSNPTQFRLRVSIVVEIPGWSDKEIQQVDLPAGGSHTYVFAPTFLPRLYSNREIVAATAIVTASDSKGNIGFNTTAPVRLRSADDMLWGTRFRYAPFIASWITPHNKQVERVLSLAKELMPGRRLPGYEHNKGEAMEARTTYAEAKAIYTALQRSGMSYVKSSITFGGNAGSSERIRKPQESLDQSSANCIDGAVMYASLFENLDMDPIVVLVPGHAYIGVRMGKGSARVLYFDTALTGRASFEDAVRAADQGLARWNPAEITRIEVNDARLAGIYPMP